MVVVHPGAAERVAPVGDRDVALDVDAPDGVRVVRGEPGARLGVEEDGGPGRGDLHTGEAVGRREQQRHAAVERDGRLAARGLDELGRLRGEGDRPRRREARGARLGRRDPARAGVPRLGPQQQRHARLGQQAAQLVRRPVGVGLVRRGRGRLAGTPGQLDGRETLGRLLEAEPLGQVARQARLRPVEEPVAARAPAPGDVRPQRRRPAGDHPGDEQAFARHRHPLVGRAARVGEPLEVDRHLLRLGPDPALAGDDDPLDPDRRPVGRELVGPEGDGDVAVEQHAVGRAVPPVAGPGGVQRERVAERRAVHADAGEVAPGQARGLGGAGGQGERGGRREPEAGPGDRRDERGGGSRSARGRSVGRACRHAAWWRAGVSVPALARPMLRARARRHNRGSPRPRGAPRHGLPKVLWASLASISSRFGAGSTGYRALPFRSARLEPGKCSPSQERG